MYIIAIHPDRVLHKNGEEQSFSDRWIELARQRGMSVKLVNALAPDCFDQILGCDAFLWRFGYFQLPRVAAKKLLPALEHGTDVLVFPDWRTSWHFEDKVAQYYLMKAAGIPTPDTWIFWDVGSALEFCRNARYPLVFKLAVGFQSGNVRLVRTSDEASFWARQMFTHGATRLKVSRGIRNYLVRARRAAAILAGRPAAPVREFELQQAYVLYQEFLPENEFDTRITVIGKRAYGFRRFNRPDDFRASGSGRIDWDPAGVDIEDVRLGFDVARRLGTQSIAIDVLRRGKERVVVEISYTYATWALRDCPGRWQLAEDGSRLEWIEGQLRPEDAIFEDLLVKLRQRRLGAHSHPHV